MVNARDQFISPADVARRLNVSVRALRLYERRGLLAPLRTSKGWRVYGPDQVARIQEILALKGLGLSLLRIAELFEGHADADLDQTLALQQSLLAVRRKQLDHAIALLNVARGRIAAGQPLTTDDLINLIRETAMSEQAWMTAIKPYYDRHFDVADYQRMKEAYDTFEPWTALIAGLNRLVATGVDPAAPEAIDFIERWTAASVKAVGGDVSLFAKGHAAWQDALADPEIAPQLPFGQTEIAFIAEAGRQWRLANPRLPAE